MSTASPLLPVSNWVNQEITVYHGTTANDAHAIANGTVDVSRGQPYRDFGPGFYTTTLRRQAEYWAKLVAIARSTSGPALLPAVVELKIERPTLANLLTLAFVRGDFDADEYWSFVSHCRAGALGHALSTRKTGLYDVVYGPVAADWRQRAVFSGADQVSFHTAAAQAVLNANSKRKVL